MKRNSLLCLFFLFLFAGWIAVNPVSAQSEPQVSDDEVNEVAQGLYCPVCENITLDVCPTQACSQWRELIREKLGQGWSKNQIEDYFVQQYGDRVLATPPKSGINWIIYFIPPIVIICGALISVQVIRRNKKTESDTAAPVREVSTQISEKLLQRIEQDVTKEEEK